MLQSTLILLEIAIEMSLVSATLEQIDEGVALQ
jgi:hypothetical protein